MNYRRHYDALIERARHRTVAGYSERHHIVPSCIGGSNAKKNIVRLTGPEHFVAHQLLVKMHPEHPALAVALLRMASNCNRNKVYGWMRERFSQYRKATKSSEETKAKIGAAQVGRKRSAETKAKLALAAIGHKRNLGKKRKPFTAETRAKMSAAKKGKKIPHLHTAILDARVANALRGRKKSPEHCAALSVAQKAAAQRRRETQLTDR